MSQLCFEGQPFGANYNPSYATNALLGHTGQDWACGYGTPIYSEFDGVVYKVLTKEKPANDGSGFTGVFMIVNNGIECFEWLVGHCDPAVTEGTTVKKGDLIGHEANHGMVYAGNIQITLAMQAAGDTRGAHRHYQKRPVKPTLTLSQPSLSSTSDANGSYRDGVGQYYTIFNYFNGYAGCVDSSKPTFSRDLWIGSSGYDVWVLQRLLTKLGHYAYPEWTGYFGLITARALSAYQAEEGISPSVGYFGPKTRADLIHYLLPSPTLSDA